MIYFQEDDVVTAGRPDTLENIKEMINLEFNIQESRKMRKFIGVYYEWGHDTKGPSAEINMEKDI